MAIPREKGLDNSLALLMEGYKYIPNRRTSFQSDIFETRLMGGQKVICIGGKEAAEVFYDNEKFRRQGAAPKRIQKTLLGENGVQTLDGAGHKHRKKLFMSLMTPERINDLIGITSNQWQIAIENWEQKKEVVLFDAAREIMCRIACEWAGVPLWAKELQQRTTDLSAMIDAFGAVGPRHWRGRQARKRSEQWIRGIIQQVRQGQLMPHEDTALYAMSWHSNLDGKLMNIEMAAVELLNILRPIVAIARYVTFGALAMYNYPESKANLQTDSEEYSQMFVQEVRRFYPFGPFLGAKVRSDFNWNGYNFTNGTLVLLDIYGTNHDPYLWEEPENFKPERFKDWQGSPFSFIPQGGGEYDIGHRCAGEWVTIEVMKVSLNFLANRIDYQVPKQNLHFSLVRMPPIPKSRFVIRKVKQK
ncbi:cytochrome P450 [Virgibacillus litoralis]|uniref:Fatty-acid peroxygenase n=1 Tax=Virgibacillus litoralis TaxID=578221 RepID=A0ABS4HGZ4_9BACI|nr:cytochrome P450 [Virgibacillus litoralis]MBP1950181.1 fatty-acid peroxygenase [Virgibacillus litoralis]